MPTRKDLTSAQKRVRWASRLGSKVTVPLYRLFGGRVMSRMAPKGAPPVFLLTTTGRRTGQPRTVALSYLSDGEDQLVVGSYGGLPFEPAWVLNLRETPEATVRIGRDEIPVSAQFVEGDAADRLWKRILDDYPIYEAPLETANREIPLIRLKRI
jgi:deazaflavin-dependent oxidoreductase (nitroreductase family)